LTREAAKAAGSETLAQRRNRRKKEAEKEKDRLNKQYQEVDAYLTTEIIESFLGDNQIAINADNEADYCPGCCTGWSSFDQVMIVAILPCNHAQKSWIDSNAALPESEQSKYFKCPLCRLDLKEDIVHSIAYAFAKRRPADLLNLLDHSWHLLTRTTSMT